MIFKDEDDVNIIQFGTGDIEVAAGMIDDPEETIGTVSFVQQQPGEIGSISQRSMKNDECVLDTFAHTRFAFTDTRSIDVVIDHLMRCKAFMQNDLSIEDQKTNRK